MICIYKNNLQKKDLICQENKKIFILSETEVEVEGFEKIPLTKSLNSLEIRCLESAYLYFKENKKVKFKIITNNKKEGILQFCCINSFKKRKIASSRIELSIDPEDFEIQIKEIPNIIKLFEFLKKKNLINTKEYFFGFLINYYFSLKL